MNFLHALRATLALSVEAGPRTIPAMTNVDKMKDIDYTGSRLFYATEGYTQNQCVRACSLTHQCRYTSFNTSTNACSLRQTHDGMSARGGIISTMSQHPTQSVVRDAYIDAKSLHGPWELTIKECSSICVEYEDCRYFSWHDGTCELFDRISDEDVQWDAVGSVFGNRPYDKIVEQGIQLVGHKDVLPNIPSEVECEAKCLVTDDCWNWTWIKSKKECYIHDDNVVDRITNRDAISGNIGTAIDPALKSGGAFSLPLSPLVISLLTAIPFFVY